MVARNYQDMSDKQFTLDDSVPEISDDEHMEEYSQGLETTKRL